MKPNNLLWVATLLAAFLPHWLDGRPADSLAPQQQPSPPALPLQKLFLHLARGRASLSSASAAVNRGWLRLTRHPQNDVGKEKRSDDIPISLDLTFHLLREVLEMARAEQVSQQAENNRKIMDTYGK